MREAEIIHWVLSFAVFLHCLGRSLPVGIFAAGQLPAAREPIPFVKIIRQAIRGDMKPIGQTNLLLAAQEQNLLIGLLDIPRLGRIIKFNGDAHRKPGEFRIELVVLQRPIHRQPHVQGPPLFASLHFVDIPERIGHGQTVGRDFALHHERIGVIENS